jgi:hypothetical protein
MSYLSPRFLHESMNIGKHEIYEKSNLSTTKSAKFTEKVWRS